MKSKLMHNLGLKIMAVLISVVLWMLAVDINDPVINKYINNVQVQLTNTGALTGQGKTVFPCAHRSLQSVQSMRRA